MSAVAKVLAFAGSTRRESYNKKILHIAMTAAQATGAEVTEVDLEQLDLPLYDGDLEAEHGLPENVHVFKELLIRHNALLIASPEYNSSMTAVLKNAIDWASRKSHSDEPPLVCFQGKVVALMSASPGALGGLRSLGHVRDVLENIGCLVLPEARAFSRVHEALDENGELKHEKDRQALDRLVRRLVEVSTKLNA